MAPFCIGDAVMRQPASTGVSCYTLTGRDVHALVPRDRFSHAEKHGQICFPLAEFARE